MKYYDQDMFDLAVCDLYSAFDRLGRTDDALAAAGIDVGDFSSMDQLRIARAVAQTVCDRYDQEMEAVGDADFTDILFNMGDDLLRDALISHTFTPERKTFSFTVHANAFLTLQIEAASEGEAREKAQAMIDAGGFVTDHYTEFEIDSDAEIM